MLDKDTKARIIDYFDGWDLVAFLQISTADIVEAFEEDIEEALDDIGDIIPER